MTWIRRSSWLTWLPACLLIWQGPSAAFLGHTILNVRAPLRKCLVVRSVTAMTLQEEAEDEGVEETFVEGQEVVLIAPPAMAGKRGTIVELVGGNAFAVRLESGSVFHLVAEHIQDTSTQEEALEQIRAPASQDPTQSFQQSSNGDDEVQDIAKANEVIRQTREDEQGIIEAGLEVTILAPLALAGKQGTIVGPVPGDAYAVRLASGSIFNIRADSLEVPKTQGLFGQLREAWTGKSAAQPDIKPAISTDIASTPAFNRQSFMDVSQALDTHGDLFSEGQEVVVLAPPAMAGKTGTVVKPVQDSSYAVRLASGSVFNIKSDSMKAAAGLGGGGGGGHGLGGSGGGSGDNGEPPNGTGSIPEAGKPGSGGVWKDLIVILSTLGISILYRMSRNKSEPLARWRSRVDKRPVHFTGSSVVGPLAAIMLLAFAAYVCFPKLFAWLQGHLQEHFPPKETVVNLPSILPLKVVVEQGAQEQSKYYGMALAGAAASFVTVIGAWVCTRRLYSQWKSQKELQSSESGVTRFFSAREEPEPESCLPLVGDEASSRAISAGSRDIHTLQPKEMEASDSWQPKEPENSSASPAEHEIQQQEKPVAKVHFEVESDAQFGDRMLIVGADPHLGAWNPEQTQVELLRDDERYHCPVWSGIWYTEGCFNLYEYKLVIKRITGETVWEEIDQRTLYVIPGHVKVQLIFDSTYQCQANSELRCIQSAAMGG
eukprot:TRINITY_DN92286_c0_g1_i1.p1 TRINITY_DN92286_c0_g1~~TRINITY_DN92286_c0_g1_i1.p1  ORF type:complete len:714 (+),score=110.01 TRINITY_DN92286_c0_g1_i1:58-2199(+)